MGLASSRGTVNSLDQRLGFGYLHKPGRSTGVLAMPGATQNRDWWFDLDASGREMREITARGIPVASIGTLDTWGNAAIRTSMSTLRTNAQATEFKSGKVHLLGMSAGGLCVLNWAKNNPTLVQSIVLVAPVLDVQAVHSENRGGYASAVNTAYGGVPPDADNPVDYATDLDGIPIRVYYSTTDDITLEAETLAFIADSGAEGVSMGAIGHFWTYEVWSGGAAADFMLANE